MYGISDGSASLKRTRPTVVLMMRRSTITGSAWMTSWSSRCTVRSTSSPVNRRRIGVSVSSSLFSSATRTSSVLPKTRPSPMAPDLDLVR